MVFHCELSKAVTVFSELTQLVLLRTVLNLPFLASLLSVGHQADMMILEAYVVKFDWVKSPHHVH
jgi:hypothetical protein